MIAQTPNYNREHTILPSQHKIQLWSNTSKGEYAIRIVGESPVVDSTCADRGQHTKLLEESNYLKDISYNWKYSLRSWYTVRQTNHHGISAIRGLIPRLYSWKHNVNTYDCSDTDSSLLLCFDLDSHDF